MTRRGAAQEESDRRKRDHGSDLAREALSPAPGLNWAGGSVLAGRYSLGELSSARLRSLGTWVMSPCSQTSSAALVCSDHLWCPVAFGWSKAAGVPSIEWRSIPTVLGGHEASRRAPKPEMYGRMSCKTQVISGELVPVNPNSTRDLFSSRSDCCASGHGRNW